MDIRALSFLGWTYRPEKGDIHKLHCAYFAQIETPSPTVMPKLTFNFASSCNTSTVIVNRYQCI